MHPQSIRHLHTNIPRLGETFIDIRLCFCRLDIPKMGGAFAVI